jgi:hypothetical protein
VTLSTRTALDCAVQCNSAAGNGETHAKGCIFQASESRARTPVPLSCPIAPLQRNTSSSVISQASMTGAHAHGALLLRRGKGRKKGSVTYYYDPGSIYCVLVRVRTWEGWGRKLEEDSEDCSEGRNDHRAPVKSLCHWHTTRAAYPSSPPPSVSRHLADFSLPISSRA